MERFLDGTVFIWCALLLLTLPLPWLMAAFVAAAFHELCHWAALRATGTKIWSIRVRTAGVRIETAPMEPKTEFLCAAAGPAGSLLLVLLWKYMPRIAFCGLSQGIYNLLPFYPLDGGRMLQAGVLLFFPEKDPGRITAAVGLAALCIAWAAGCHLAGTPGLWLLFPVLFPFLKEVLRKIPCKETKHAVQ